MNGRTARLEKQSKQAEKSRSDKYMQNVRVVELNEQNNEEVLPGYTEEFPYIATCARINEYLNSDIPWHWHRQVELFYMKSGSLEYTTPHGSWTFTEGMAGMVNSNILHCSRPLSLKNENVQLLHIFDPVFLAGEHGSQMEKKYIFPLTANRDVEVIMLHPEKAKEKKIIDHIQAAFSISEQKSGYEFELRESLAKIWLNLLELTELIGWKQAGVNRPDEKIKSLMIYVHEHYQEPISVEQLAESVYISKRACFRMFQENLHMSPVEYVHSFRIQRACQLLSDEQKTITEIAQECGFGTSSYFGKLFRRKMDCTPEQYRRKMARLL